MTKPNFLSLSRRSLLKWTSLGIALSALPLAKGLRAKSTAAGSKAKLPPDEWRSAACWHNCGGRCVNKVLLADGVAKRQKTDDMFPDTSELPQQRACVRGRALRKEVFGLDRLKYPMKRKNWQPGGGDRSLRGRDQWVRISWDDALDIVASESKRIKEQYGNESIWVTGEGKPYLDVYSQYGGYLSDWGTTSLGAWKETAKYIGVHDGWTGFGTHDRFDLHKSQLIVLWGVNPAWSSPGNPTYHYLSARRSGVKFICIDPSYSVTCELLDADWVPINPGTDHALALGIMYALLEMDDPRGNALVDWEFLHRYTVGFDRDHMPEGTNPNDNFQDYLLGTFTKEPKSPEWAQKICGVRADVIRQLASMIGGTEQASLISGWAPARIHNGEGWVHAFSTLGFMTGHMGQSGQMTGVNCHFAAANAGPPLVKAGADGLPTFANPVKTRINHNEINRALSEGRCRQRGLGDQNVSIQMMFHSFNATMQSRTNIIQLIDSIRKNVEFIVTPAYVLNTNAKYSDLVLPITTEWEREGCILEPSNRDTLMAAVNITPPLYEAKSDQWIAKALAKRLGLDADEIFPISEKQQFFNRLQGATVVNEDGKTDSPLLTITAQDIQDWNVTGTPQDGRISLAQFLQQGCYQVERQPNDNYGYIAYSDFINDPEANPRPTESGKFEIYCRQLNEAGKEYGWSDVPPIPKYIASVKGYEESFSDWSNGMKGQYPFQLYTPHYLRSANSSMDNVPWLREAWPSPIYLNKLDGVQLGIRHGETVLVSNLSGKLLRQAFLSEMIKPGTLMLPHGGWFEFDEQSEVDLGGADNTISEQVPTGLGTSGWNTVLCNIEKWSGTPLMDDELWPQRIIFEEAE